MSMIFRGVPVRRSRRRPHPLLALGPLPSYAQCADCRRVLLEVNAGWMDLDDQELTCPHRDTQEHVAVQLGSLGESQQGSTAL